MSNPSEAPGLDPAAPTAPRALDAAVDALEEDGAEAGPGGLQPGHGAAPNPTLFGKYLRAVVTDNVTSRYEARF